MTRLPAGYGLEHTPDVLGLRRADGSFVAVFSAQGVTKEAIMRAIEEDREGLPAYFGPEEYADSARRLVETWRKHSWERFLRTERRVLEARRNGWMAKALAWRLPGESQEELDRIASEDRWRAEEGLVELKSERGELSYKHLESLSPEDLHVQNPKKGERLCEFIETKPPRCSGGTRLERSLCGPGQRTTALSLGRFTPTETGVRKTIGPTTRTAILAIFRTMIAEVR